MTTAVDTEKKTTPADKVGTPAKVTPKAKSNGIAFDKLVPQLAAAEAEAKVASGDAAQARAKKGGLALEALRAAFTEGITSDDVRKALIGGGVLKGTVSKIITVLSALNDKTIGLEQVKSLNGAYTAVKEAAKIAAAGSLSAGAPTTAYSTPTPAVVATTPEQAMQVILDAIKAVADPDEAAKLASEWLSRLTKELTEAARAAFDRAKSAE